MVNRWIQKIGMKKGAFSKQLGIAEEKKIPSSLLNKIIKTNVGKVITNPTKTGRKRIKVTGILKKRANLVRNLKRIKR